MKKETNKQTMLQQSAIVCNFRAKYGGSGHFFDKAHNAKWCKANGISTENSEKLSRTTFSKFGITGQKMFDAIQSHYKHALSVHNSFLLCKMGDAQYGDGIMSNESLIPHAERMNELETTFIELVTNFLNAYEQIKNDAIFLYGNKVTSSMYPSVDEMKAKFAWNVERTPLPESNSVSNLSSEWEQEIVESTERRLNEVFDSAVSNLVKKLKGFVANINTQTKTNGGISAITLDNFGAFIETVPQLNISKCPKISKICEDAINLFKYAPESTNDDAIKQELEDKSQSILNDLDLLGIGSSID